MYPNHVNLDKDQKDELRPAPTFDHGAAGDSRTSPIQAEDGFQTRHPLMLIETVEVILRHVSSFHELKSFRLVNSIWNTASARVMSTRPCGWITFSLRSRWTNGGLKGMREFVEMLDTTFSPTFPCRKFCVDAGFHEVDAIQPQEKQAVVESFFQRVAPFVKELKLTDFSQNGHRLFPAGPSQLNIQYPRLRSLTCHMRERRVVRSRPISPQVVESNMNFFRNILTNSPRLVEVHADLLGEYNIHGLCALDHLRRQPLQKLTLVGQLVDGQFIRLVKIQELCLELHPGMMQSGETLTRFLQMQSDDLRELKVHLKLGYSLLVTLPPMPHLRKLELESPDPSGVPAPVVTLQRSFPALHTLTLRSVDVGVFFDFTAIARPMPSVAQLDINLLGNQKPDFSEIARVLPNLRKLRVTERESSINFADLAPLESVEEFSIPCLSVPYEADKLLTGYSYAELVPLKWLPDARLVAASQETADPSPFLRRLRKLTLTGKSMGISDIACRLVLLKLPNLTCLDLKEGEVYFRPGISPQVLTEMRDKFTLLMHPHPTYPVEPVMRGVRIPAATR